MSVEDWDTDYSFPKERRSLCEKIFKKIDNYTNDSEGWYIMYRGLPVGEKYRNDQISILKNSLRKHLWTLDYLFTDTKPVNIDDDDETQHNIMCLSNFNKENYLTLSYFCKNSKCEKQLWRIELGNWY